MYNYYQMQTTVIDRTIMKPFVALTPKWLKPNQITAVRLFLIPFILSFLFLGYYKIGGIIFTIAAFTDALDGAVARTRDQITNFGKVFDPIVDKLLIITTGAILMLKFLPDWVFWMVFLLETITVVLAATIKYKKGVDITANIFGKIKMILQCVGLILIFINAAFFPAPALITAAFFIFLASIVLSANSLLYDMLMA